MSCDNQEWDGRALFYPELGYTLDKEIVERFKESEWWMGDDPHPSSDEDSSQDSQADSDHSNGDDGGLTEKIMFSPPLYKREEHYHPWEEKTKKLEWISSYC